MPQVIGVSSLRQGPVCWCPGVAEFSPHASRAAGAATPQNPWRRRRLGSSSFISGLIALMYAATRAAQWALAPDVASQHGVLPGGWLCAGASTRGGGGLTQFGVSPRESPRAMQAAACLFHSSILCMDSVFLRGAWLGVPAAPPQSPFRIRRVLWMLARDMPCPSWVSSSNHQPQADFARGACYYCLLTCRQGLPAFTCPEAQRSKGRGVCTSLPG